MAPDNKPSQKESNLPTIIFQGRTVKLRGCRLSRSLRLFDPTAFSTLEPSDFFFSVFSSNETVGVVLVQQTTDRFNLSFLVVGHIRAAGSVRLVRFFWNKNCVPCGNLRTPYVRCIGYCRIGA